MELLRDTELLSCHRCASQGGKKWHRDPKKPLADNEVTRFPHAILDVKLELGGDNVAAPQWLTELQNSGMLYEVHKFSKFIHGCATLLPEYVRSVPYWVDDASVRESVLRSGRGRILVKPDHATGVGPGANEVYDHLLPFGIVKAPQLDAKGRTANMEALVEVSEAEDGSSNRGKHNEAVLTFHTPQIIKYCF